MRSPAFHIGQFRLTFRFLLSILLAEIGRFVLVGAVFVFVFFLSLCSSSCLPPCAPLAETPPLWFRSKSLRRRAGSSRSEARRCNIGQEQVEHGSHSGVRLERSSRAQGFYSGNYSGNQVLLHRAITAAIGTFIHWIGEFARMDAGSFKPSTQGAG